MSYDPKSSLWQEAVAEYRSEQAFECERDETECSMCGEECEAGSNRCCARCDAELSIKADGQNAELAQEREEIIARDREECGWPSWRYEVIDDAA